MPTLAAVPSQRATQGTTKRPKRPNVVNEAPKRTNVVNEAPGTVRLHKNSDKVRVTNQQSDVEYTIYTFQVNIQSIDRQFLRLSFSASKALCYAL